VSGDLGFENIVRFPTGPITASLWLASQTTGPAASSTRPSWPGCAGSRTKRSPGTSSSSSPGESGSVDSHERADGIVKVEAASPRHYPRTRCGPGDTAKRSPGLAVR
jgi:hypothetical protein